MDISNTDHLIEHYMHIGGEKDSNGQYITSGENWLTGLNTKEKKELVHLYEKMGNELTQFKLNFHKNVYILAFATLYKHYRQTKNVYLSVKQLLSAINKVCHKYGDKILDEEVDFYTKVLEEYNK